MVRAHSPISGSFECPNHHPQWSPVSIGKPAPKIHQWTIYFCRWGFGWVDKAQCFRSARRFGAAGLSPDFSRGFSRHGASRPLSWTFFQCTLLSYQGQPSYSNKKNYWIHSLRPAGGDPEIDRPQKYFFAGLCFFEWPWPFWTPLKAFREEAVWFKQRKTRRKVAPFLTPLGAARAARSVDWLKIDMWENPSFDSSGSRQLVRTLRCALSL